MATQKDPFKYFRIEGRELFAGLSAGVLELEKGASVKQTVDALLRLAHTLKGASRVVKQSGIADLAHALEDVLGPFREGQATLPAEVINGLLRSVDAIKVQLDALDLPAPAPVTAPLAASLKLVSPPPPSAPTPNVPVPPSVVPAPVEERFETLRVEIAEVDALLDGTSELNVRMGAFRTQLEASAKVEARASALVAMLSNSDATRKEKAAAEELRFAMTGMRHGLTTALERAEDEVSQVVERAQAIRLVPASVVFGALERGVRDAAQSDGKQVELVTHGGDTRLDGHVLSAMKDALLHVLTNATSHGIETPAVRKAAGKSAQGRIILTVERRGSQVAFSCRDDGGGVDVAAVRDAAVKRGLLSLPEANALSTEEATTLIFAPGLSTRSTLSVLAGRGVGMDVVREIAERLKGSATVRSEQGLGTTVEICVPVSLSSLNVLAVMAGDIRIGLPIDAIRRTRRIEPNDICRTGDGEALQEDGKTIPFVSLGRFLAGGEPSRRPCRSVLILKVGPDALAVGVDQILQIESVVLRRLPAVIGALPVYAGASFDADGNPQPIVDPAGLMQAIRTEAGVCDDLAPVAAKLPPVLVIDDSLTTRMLEKNILESAGYEVDIAVSGEDGMAKAGLRAYGLFVCDVDMPGMSGFDFVTQTRADPVLKKVPAILVTSRNSAEDKKRGADAGASGYIVKGEFDQQTLLGRIRDLIGGAR